MGWAGRSKRKEPKHRSVRCKHVPQYGFGYSQKMVDWLAINIDLVVWMQEFRRLQNVRNGIIKNINAVRAAIVKDT